MEQIHIITPVKNSIDLTLQTIEAVKKSVINTPHTYTIYNDFSTPENTARLEESSVTMGFELVNLSDLTTHPSPNYLLILQTAQRKAIAANAGLLIIESDVVVKQSTIQSLFDGAMERDNVGIAAAVTVDHNEEINYPYLFARGRAAGVYLDKKHLSFCCTLLSLNLLKAYDFSRLNPRKHWFDVVISNISRRKGFDNYLFTTLTAWHKPHASRPWKNLKYENRIKYYFLKLTKGLDKI